MRSKAVPPENTELAQTTRHLHYAVAKHRLLGSADVWTYWFGLELPRHLSHFTLRSLRYLMKDAGFQEVRIVIRRYPIFNVAWVLLGRASLKNFDLCRRLSRRQYRAHSSENNLESYAIFLIAPFALLASAACGGASIEGVFRKGEPAPSAVDPAMRR